MADVARLGLAIDGTQIVQAKGQLDQFSASAERAEKSTRAYQRAANDRVSTDDIAAAASEYDRLRGATDAVTAAETSFQRAKDASLERFRVANRQAAEEYAALNDQLDRQAVGSGRAVGGIGRLNNSLAVLARQATGTHPVVGQLTDVIGTFAIGTARMVPVLAGIAALGFAMRKFGEEAREAKRELEGHLDVLRKIADQRDLDARGGARGAALTAAQDEARRIAEILRGAAGDAIIGPGGAVSSAEPLRARLRELNALIREGRGAEGDDARDERARLRRERLRIQQEVEAAAQRHQDRLTEIEREAEAERARDRRIRLASNEREAAAQRQSEEDAEAERARNRRIRLAAREREAREETERARAAELEYQQAQDRALNNLVRSLENVGRAYGGVADQVLALVAATLSLERVPLESRRDRAIGYASAGLAGIGYGQSTGNAGLGGIGGAASGFAIAGPAGAVIGGVAGIVSGLIESGQRAREAARVWDRAFRDFRDMFDNPTELESRIRSITDQFEDLRAALYANARGVSGWQEAVQAEEELVRTRDRLIEQARALAEAENQRFREDLDVRFLRAQGLDEDAERLRLQLQQQREYEDAVKRGADAATLAFLREVQAAESAAAAAERARQEWDRLLGVQNAPAGFDLRFYSEHYGAGWRPNVGAPNGPSTEGVVVHGNLIIIDDGGEEDIEDRRERALARARSLDLRSGALR